MFTMSKSGVGLYSYTMALSSEARFGGEPAWALRDSGNAMLRERKTVTINRAPVLTLWAAVVAQRLGFRWDEALTLGRAVAGLNAYSKGKALGLFKPAPKAVREARAKARARVTVDILHRAVPVARTTAGLRALSGGRPIDPDSVRRYLEGKFKDALAPARRAMAGLARSLPPGELNARGFRLYEKFRPEVASGTAGWGAAGVLDLRRIARLKGG